MRFRFWVVNVLLGADQTINAVFGGDPDESISSRAAKAQRKGHRWGCALCAFLSFFEPDHCEKSLEADEGKRTL